MTLVPLFEPEVRNSSCSTMCANFGFGALAQTRRSLSRRFRGRLSMDRVWANCPQERSKQPMDTPDPFHLFPYRAIVDHPPIAWPNGAKGAVWVIPNIE